MRCSSETGTADGVVAAMSVYVIVRPELNGQLGPYQKAFVRVEMTK